MIQKGLGKGLGALLSAYDEEDGNEQMQKTTAASFQSTDSSTGKIVTRVTKSASTDVIEIDVSLIDSNPNQPRKEFDPEKMAELMDSIRTHGVLQPIVLNIVGSRYMIVAGERRWQAAKSIGLKKIPAVVKQFSRSQIAEIAIVENLQRQDLNEIELARGIKRLIDDFSLTQEQAAARVGKNRSAIAHTLRLLSLPQEIIQLVEQNKLSAGHARCLVTLQDKEKAIRLAKLCIQDNLSVRDLEKLIQAKPSSPTTVTKSRQSLELKELTQELTSILRTKVTILGDNTKGKIIIDYFTSQDLIRVKKNVIDVNRLVSFDDEIKARFNRKDKI